MLCKSCPCKISKDACLGWWLQQKHHHHDDRTFSQWGSIGLQTCILASSFIAADLTRRCYVLEFFSQLTLCQPWCIVVFLQNRFVTSTPLLCNPIVKGQTSLDSHSHELYDWETKWCAGNANRPQRPSHHHTRQPNGMAISHHCLHKGASWHDKQMSQNEFLTFSSQMNSAKNSVEFF
jgi:hypothetical protein